jgi:hypothetical protein
LKKKKKGQAGLKKNPARTHGMMAGHQWLTPIILATQEAEIRKIKVRGQPKEIV